VVAVDVADVRTMVHAVMRRCAQDHFQGPERSHQFGESRTGTAG
jgi:hypothetical protein